MTALVPYTFGRSLSLFDEMLSDFFKKDASSSNCWQPAVDIFETSDGYNLKVDIPGMSPDDIKISVDDGVLSISGERKNETESSDDRGVRFERSYGKFVRSWKLGDAVHLEDIGAKYDKGVLEISLKKRIPDAPKRIEVKIR